MAFTLVELVLVVAVIGVLAVLALPKAKQMVERSHAATCASNLRKIHSGLMAYVADNNGQLVPAAIIQEAGRTGQWYNVLEPYMGSGSLSWVSPQRPKWQCCPSKKFADMSVLTVGYGWNYRYFGKDNFPRNPSAPDPHSSANAFSFTRLAEVPRPARTIIIGDSLDDTQPANDFRHRYIYPPGPTTASFLAKRHGGRGNYLFLDGHVEALSPEELLQDAVNNPNSSLFMQAK